MCIGHYHRWRRNGEPGPVRFRVLRHEAVCSISTCDAPYHAQGYCQRHYETWHRRGDPEAQVRQHSSSLQITEHEMSIIADTSIPADDAAQLVGRSRTTVYAIRRKMNLGTLRLSDWSPEETNFIIEHRGSMEMAAMAEFLQRPMNQVFNETTRLRREGVLGELTTQRLAPWIVSDRPLLAKTCLKCDLLLDGEWFPMRPNKNGSKKHYATDCKRCQSDRVMNRPGRKTSERKYMAKVQAYTLERAENHRKEWTSSDLEVLKDESKTVLQKALELQRTYQAVTHALHKNGLTSEPVRLGDPSDSAWHLLWEFDDLDDDDLEDVS